MTYKNILVQFAEYQIIKQYERSEAFKEAMKEVEVCDVAED